MNLNSKVSTYCLLILTTVAVAMALAYTRSVMIPFAFSIFIAFLVAPIIDLLRLRLKFPQWAATTSGILLVFMCIVLLGYFLVNFVRRLVVNVDIYQDRLLQAAMQLTGTLAEWGVAIDRKLVLETLRDLPLFNYFTAAAGQVVGISADVILIMIFLIFLLAGKHSFHSQSGLFATVGKSVRRYIVTKFLISAATAILVAITLKLFSVDMAVTFAVLTFVLNFIPTLGSIIATLIPIPVALLQFDGLITPVILFGVLGAIQFVMGSLIDPKLVGHTSDLHPATVLLSLMFWGLIWGVAGMFLAVPLMLIIKLLLEQSKDGTKVANLLAGRTTEEPDPIRAPKL
jgi:AI-2 transport protein TqsA